MDVRETIALQEKVARVIVCALADHGIDEPSGDLAYADDILEIAEIKAGLMLLEERLNRGGDGEMKVWQPGEEPF